MSAKTPFDYYSEAAESEFPNSSDKNHVLDIAQAIEHLGLRKTLQAIIMLIETKNAYIRATDDLNITPQVELKTAKAHFEKLEKEAL